MKYSAWARFRLILAVSLLAGLGVACNKTPPAEPHANGHKEGRGAAYKPAAARQAMEEPSRPAGPPSRAADAKAELEVIAYYFHPTMRCPTCRSIEQLAHEAVQTAYSEELRVGELEWHAVNIEEEGNEHFEDDFELVSSSLVLVGLRDGKVTKWKNLERVWELVQDPLGFQEYVWSELVEYLPG